jgi:gamma-glutamylcyclotransferase (GGCT)/AIG2-like uncharacterized protein YtfP
LFDTGCGYPALSPGLSGRVYGECYEVTEEILYELNHLEGYYGHNDPGNYYDRVIVKAYALDRTIECLTYIFTKNKTRGLEVIVSGDWRKHTNAE